MKQGYALTAMAYPGIFSARRSAQASITQQQDERGDLGPSPFFCLALGAREGGRLRVSLCGRRQSFHQWCFGVDVSAETNRFALSVEDMPYFRCSAVVPPNSPGAPADTAEHHQLSLETTALRQLQFRLVATRPEAQR
jgi:hypothetical protein